MAVPLSTRIIEVRGVKVVLDADLAELYAVSTKALNQAIKRNRQKFPPDFMFRLTKGEKAEVVTNCDHLQLSLRGGSSMRTTRYHSLISGIPETWKCCPGVKSTYTRFPAPPPITFQHEHVLFNGH